MTTLAGFCGDDKHLMLAYLGLFFHWSEAYSSAKRGRSVSHRPWFFCFSQQIDAMPMRKNKMERDY